MKKYFTLVFGLFLCLPLTLLSQFDIKCGHDTKMEVVKRMDLEYSNSLNQPIPQSPKTQRFIDIITIPVHVIIVHPPGQAEGSGDNLSMAHINSQIDVMNEDFRRLNNDAANTPPVFPAADAMIEFCLAIIDPDGNPTDGVTRYGTNQNLNTNETAIKSATGWDRNQYLNIWVGPNIPYLGWAYLPTTTNLPNATLDGIVVLTGAFGGPGYGTTNNYDLGRTATHEIGHYLGLRHVWGNGGCGNDDGIVDTPIQSGSNFGCPTHPSPSCGNGGDMFMNYMDYVDDDCMNAFTEDQADYMNLILNTSRSSLLDAANTLCDSYVPLTIEILEQTNVLCFGESTGSVTVQAFGGTGNYTYSIDGGPSQNSNTFTGLSAGQHTVEAQDDGGSSITIEVVIIEPPVLVPSIDSQFDVTCFGNDDGLIIATAFGGTPAPGGSYLYSIDGINFTPNNVFDNLSAGFYTITIQDNNLCQASLETLINSPEELISVPDEINDIDCNGNENGMISLVTNGGTPVYSYSIDQINYQNENTFFGLASGSYLATTMDANGCIAEFPFIISEPDPLELTIAQQEDLLCFNDASGSITLEAVGGTIDYQFSIDNVNFQNEPFFDGLSAGSYTLYVLDQNNCSSETITDLQEPEELLIALDDQTNVDCFGGNNGAVTLSASGGVNEYTFTLGDETITNESATFTNLTTGFYTVNLEDGNACGTSLEVEIIGNPEIALETISVENVSCFEGDNGIIEVIASGGEGNFLYSINGEDYAPESIFENLAAGSYTITAQDILGCENNILVTLEMPDEIITQIDTQVDNDCFGESTASVQVSSSGGTGTITYTIGNTSNTTGLFENLAAGDYSLLAEDQNSCTQETEVLITQPEEISITETSNTAVDCNGNNSGNFQVAASGGTGDFEYTLNGTTNTTGTFENLTAGTYEVIASDENACTHSLNVNITEPELLEASIESVTNINCAGANSGAIQVIAEGGTGNFTFTLNGNSNATGYFEGLDQGDYTISVSDENSCETSISATVESSGNLEIQEDENVGVLCFGENNGSIQLSISGSSGDFEFTLNGETNTTGLFENLAAGTYTVTATDHEDCSGTIEFTIQEPEVLTTQLENQSNIPCYGEASGSFQITASGGTQGYTYSLGTETNDSGIFDNLSAGDYEVITTDINNCQTNISISLEQAPELTATVSEVQEVDCNGLNNGSFNITANGGTGNYQFTANNETNSTGIFNNLTSGNYNILVTDENDCSYALDVSIPEPPALSVTTPQTTLITCFDGNDGTVQFQASGGTGVLEYSYNNETNTSGYFENLPAGNYELIILDANGCSISMIQSIEEPAELLSEVIETSNNNCFDEKAGTVQLAASGGTGAYQFSMGPNSNPSGYFENLASGTFEVVVTDENGCSTAQSFSITQPDELFLEVLELQDIDCINNPVGTVQVQATGGTGSYQYQFGAEINDNGFFGNLSEGTIEITVMDDNDCITYLSIEIGATQEIEAEILNMQAIDCFGENNGSVLINGIGGTGVYTYNLDGQINNSGFFENLPVGDYQVFIADENDCDAVIEFTINEPEAIISQIINSQEILCYGDASGGIQISAQGGNGSFQYTLGNETNNTGIFQNLPAGDYEILITDITACTSGQAFSISEPEELQGEAIKVVPLTCFGQLAVIQTEVWGGTAPYVFTLGDETNDSGQFEIASGNYEIFITDANDCVIMLNLEVIEPSEMNAQVQDLENVDCFGNSSGSVQLAVQGGTPGYSYELDTENNATGYFENLPTGTYTAIVSDVNSCTTTIDFEITEPENLEAGIEETQPIDCFGASNGAIQLGATGGTPGYEYTLGNETNTTGSFENLSAGPYSLQVTDSNGCTIENIITISEPEQLSLSTTALSNDLGNGEGSMTLDAQGGTAPYQYALNNVDYQASNVFDNLIAGIYAVFVKDANGCITEIKVEIKLETGLTDPEKGIEEINILPNPFSDELNLNIDLINGQHVQLRMFTIHGKELYAAQFSLGQGSHNLRLDLPQALAAGAYILSVQTENGYLGSFRLVRQ